MKYFESEEKQLMFDATKEDSVKSDIKRAEC